MSQSEKVIPWKYHEHDFSVAIWDGGKGHKSVILRQTDPETCPHCEHEDLYIEIPFDTIGTLIADLIEWRAEGV